MQVENVLELNNISFEGVFQNINIQLPHGQIYCLIGHVGSGKSLLMKIAAGLIEPTTGEVLLQDKSLYEISRSNRLKIMERIGFLFQNTALVSNMDIFDNVALVLRYHTKLKEDEIADKVHFYLNKFMLTKKEHLMPSDLSLGEQKLAGFARAMVNDPDILILDDPTVLIDKKTMRFMTDLLEEYKEEQKTIFMSSNNTEVIFNISDKLGILLDNTLKIQGEPYEIKYTENQEIRELLSSIKIVKKGQVESEILKLLK